MDRTVLSLCGFFLITFGYGQREILAEETCRRLEILRKYANADGTYTLTNESCPATADVSYYVREDPSKLYFYMIHDKSWGVFHVPCDANSFGFTAGHSLAPWTLKFIGANDTAITCTDYDRQYRHPRFSASGVIILPTLYIENEVPNAIYRVNVTLPRVAEVVEYFLEVEGSCRTGKLLVSLYNESGSFEDREWDLCTRSDKTTSVLRFSPEQTVKGFSFYANIQLALSENLHVSLHYNVTPVDDYFTTAGADISESFEDTTVANVNSKVPPTETLGAEYAQDSTSTIESDAKTTEIKTTVPHDIAREMTKITAKTSKETFTVEADKIILRETTTEGLRTSRETSSSLETEEPFRSGGPPPGDTTKVTEVDIFTPAVSTNQQTTSTVEGRNEGITSEADILTTQEKPPGTTIIDILTTDIDDITTMSEPFPMMSLDITLDGAWAMTGDVSGKTTLDTEIDTTASAIWTNQQTTPIVPTSVEGSTEGVTTEDHRMTTQQKPPGMSGEDILTTDMEDVTTLNGQFSTISSGITTNDRWGMIGDLNGKTTRGKDTTTSFLTVSTNQKITSTVPTSEGGSTEGVTSENDRLTTQQKPPDIIVCKQGYYLDNTTKECGPCPAGYYQDSYDGMGCKPCPLGHYQRTEGQSSCIACPQGTYQSKTNQIACIHCPVGRYQSEVGSPSCIDCPTHKTTKTSGASKKQDCNITYCPSGYEEKPTDSGQCVPCGYDSYKDNNDDPFSGCQPCRTGLITLREASVSADDCIRDPCLSLTCEYGAVCVLGQCQCPPSCPHVLDPVCGSDGITYTSPCDLTNKRCHQRLNVTVINRGECKNDPCVDVHCTCGQSCVKGQCTCPEDHNPVCANDSITYKSECHMLTTACSTNKPLRLLYNVPCENISTLPDIAEVGQSDGTVEGSYLVYIFVAFAVVLTMTILIIATVVLVRRRREKKARQEEVVPMLSPATRTFSNSSQSQRITIEKRPETPVEVDRLSGCITPMNEHPQFNFDTNSNGHASRHLSSTDTSQPEMTIDQSPAVVAGLDGPIRASCSTPGPERMPSKKRTPSMVDNNVYEKQPETEAVINLDDVFHSDEHEVGDFNTRL